MNKIILIIITAAVAIFLLAGSFYTGLFIGNKKGFIAGEKQGKEQGFKDGQKAAQDAIDAANPYAELDSAANPFQVEYENPF